MSDTFGYCGCGYEQFKDDGNGQCENCGEKIIYGTIEYGLEEEIDRLRIEHQRNAE